jgi:rod shape determining protein RodA
MSNNFIYRLDWWLILIYLFLVTVGIVNVYSATYTESLESIFDFSQLVGKQLLFLFISIFLGAVILGINIKFFEHFATLSYITSILLLVGLFFFGKTVSGATSWYDLGGFSLQPSEFAKIGTAMMIAKYMGKFQSDLKKYKTLLKVIGYLLIPFILIVLQPDPGSALVYFAFFFPLLREGLNFAYLITFLSLLALFFISLSFKLSTSIGIIGIITFVIYLILKKFNSKIKIWPFILTFITCIGFSFSVDHIFNNLFEQRHRDRINVVIGKTLDSKGVGYNINQSKIAIGSGGLIGKGFLQGTQTKGDFVPEQQTDYIFSTIGEEWGFLGGFLVILMFGILIIRILIRAEKQNSKFRRVFSYGVAGLIFIHFFVNIGMTLGMVPTIGIPLPFISYGGSSLLAFSLMIFIHLNFDANRLNEW